MGAHNPTDPNFRDKVIESFQKQGFMKHIGAEIKNVEPGKCQIEVPFRGVMELRLSYFLPQNLLRS